jgi:hypothetical protein
MRPIERLQPTMANRPRRSSLTQKFAIPNEDYIYDDIIIVLLDESGPTEDTNSSGSYDIRETLAAFLNNLIPDLTLI